MNWAQAYFHYHVCCLLCTGAAAAAATPWDELGAGERAVRSFLALEAISGAPAAWKFLSQVRSGYHCAAHVHGWW